MTETTGHTVSHATNQSRMPCFHLYIHHNCKLVFLPCLFSGYSVAVCYSEVIFRHRILNEPSFVVTMIVSAANVMIPCGQQPTRRIATMWCETYDTPRISKRKEMMYVGWPRLSTNIVPSDSHYRFQARCRIGEKQCTDMREPLHGCN